MDNPDIRNRNSDIVRTYYSGRKSPAARKAAILPGLNTVLHRRFLLLGVFLILSAAVWVVINHFFGIGERPIDIVREQRSIPSGAGLVGNISYYDYKQIKSLKAPILLEGPRSSAAVNLGRAMNLADGVISFRAKGAEQAERVAIILRDVNRLSNANRQDVILTPVLADNEWQSFKIRLKGLYLPLDKARVTQVRLDLSAQFTENNPAARVYIKDLAIEE